MRRGFVIKSVRKHVYYYLDLSTMFIQCTTDVCILKWFPDVSAFRSVYNFQLQKTQYFYFLNVYLFLLQLLVKLVLENIYIPPNLFVKSHDCCPTLFIFRSSICFIEVKGACPEIFGKLIFLKLADKDIFLPIYHPWWKNCKYESD